MNLGKNQLEFHGNIYNHVITESDSNMSIIFKVIYYCKNLRNSAKVAAKWLLIKYLSI